MSIFGIGESKREKVKKIRGEERKRLLKYRRVERGREAKEREIESRTKLTKTEATYYEAKERKKEAKKGASFKLPTLTIKKKKQGRKLSRKRRITLI